MFVYINSNCFRTRSSPLKIYCIALWGGLNFCKINGLRLWNVLNNFVLPFSNIFFQFHFAVQIYFYLSLSLYYKRFTSFCFNFPFIWKLNGSNEPLKLFIVQDFKAHYYFNYWSAEWITAVLTFWTIYLKFQHNIYKLIKVFEVMTRVFIIKFKKKERKFVQAF